MDNQTPAVDAIGDVYNLSDPQPSDMVEIESDLFSPVLPCPRATHRDDGKCVLAVGSVETVLTTDPKPASLARRRGVHTCARSSRRRTIKTHMTRELDHEQRFAIRKVRIGQCAERACRGDAVDLCLERDEAPLYVFPNICNFFASAGVREMRSDRTFTTKTSGHDASLLPELLVEGAAGGAGQPLSNSGVGYAFACVGCVGPPCWDQSLGRVPHLATRRSSASQVTNSLEGGEPFRGQHRSGRQRRSR
jgi:hypothetical protein